MTAVLIDEHVYEKVFNDRIAELLALFVIKESALYFEGLLLFLYLIAVLIPMVMGRFLIDIYPISPFTSIREEQGLIMEAVYPVYHSRKAWVLDKLIL
jgi:hypothetical protein